MKRIVALITSLACLSICLTAHAEVEQSKDTIRVGEYDCYVNNGQYYTDINGENYLVINLDDAIWQSEDEMVCSQTSNDVSSLYSLEASTDWLNSPQVDISDGSTYNGMIDITYGDDCTPIFCGKPYASDVSYQIYAGFIFPNTYNINIHFYNDISRQWSSYKQAVTFDLFGQTKFLLTGTMSMNVTKVCIEFYKNGSSGETPMYYSFRQVFGGN